jgi:CheY-like chemotaxis protein
MPAPCSEHQVAVLVVDDDRDIRESLAEILRDEGYRVETATNGAEAISAVGRAPPCLMLLDLMMPVMTGWQVIQRLGDDKLDIPYCVISASDAPAASICTLRKPIDIDALLRIVAAHCGKPAI